LNGKKEGVWSYYSETGILLKTEVYENDKLISTTAK
jgi:antitoxin component YwqK of YwqJK toxin-antitoxin module